MLESNVEKEVMRLEVTLSSISCVLTTFALSWPRDTGISIEAKYFLTSSEIIKKAQVVIFWQIRKALSCVFFCPSVRMEQLGSHWMEYH